MITATDISNLLIEKKSEKFICIPECKTGKSWGAKYRIIDLWCMAKSWTRPLTIAYEIKISRSDFLQDHKWRLYLDYCNEFYFVSPPGLIHPNELPPEAGLICCSKNCTTLYTKKKAPHRDILIPENLYRYILMWRTDIKSERFEQDNKRYWQQWLEERKEKKTLGFMVSKRISELYNENVERVDKENRDLKREIETLNEVKEILAKLNFNPNTWNLESKLKQKIQEINTGISGDFLASLDVSIKNLQIARKVLSADGSN